MFQGKVDETFGDIPGVTGIADDIVVVGYQDFFFDTKMMKKTTMQISKLCWNLLMKKALS